MDSPEPASPAGPSSRALRLLFPLYLAGARSLPRSRRLTRRLFGVRVPPDLRVSWDLTTLVLREALRRRASPGSRVLEMGVGEGAVLCIYLARRRGILADGVDVIPARVERSRRMVRLHGLDLRIWQSDLFEAVHERYDLIFFNSVYIPAGWGELHGLVHPDSPDPRAWSGGPRGTETIARFLAEAPRFLSDDGRVLLGVNHLFVPPRRMERAIRASPLAEIDRIRFPLCPSVVYVLGSAGKARQRGS